MVAVLALLTVAPAAEAGNGRGKQRRYKQSYGERYRGHDGSRWSRNDDRGHRGHRGRGRRVVEIHRSSNAGPVIAGIIGGIALGAALSNHGRSHVRHDRGYHRDRGDCGPRRSYRSAGYAYYDPYCDARYESLDACSGHMRSCDHPRLVQKVHASSGEYVEEYHYKRGTWSSHQVAYQE
jgi:hypothetical protein